MKYNESHLVLLERYLRDASDDESLYALIKVAISSIEQYLKGAEAPVLPIRLNASLFTNSLNILPDDTDFTSRDIQHAIKATELKTVYEAAANKSIKVNDVTWDGGFDSALKLDGAERLAKKAGLSSVSVFDADNVEHVLPFTVAKAVVKAISTAFQQCLGVKQSIARDLVTADASALADFDIAAEFKRRLYKKIKAQGV